MIDSHAPRSTIPRPAGTATRRGFGVALLISLIAAFAIACTSPGGGGATAAPQAPAATGGTSVPPPTDNLGY